MNRFIRLHGEKAVTPQLATGWQLSKVTGASDLFGANGIQFGPDGRLYVAQALGSQVTAIDPDTGELEVISPNGGAITGPDDLAFDSKGNMYATEVMSKRVSMRTPDGEISIVADELPSANGITVFNDRLFIDEHRHGGRLFELYPFDDRAPRLIADNLASPNALAAGPDGKLYFPLVPKGEIWRVDPDVCKLEKVTEGLFHPPAAKFSPSGELIIPQAGNGEVVKVDTTTGAHTLIAKVRPGIDNLAFDTAGRLFLSHFIDGGVAEVSMDGKSHERVLVEAGWVGPYGIAADPSGTCFVLDGLGLVQLEASGSRSTVGDPLDRNAPRFVRAVACGESGEFLLTTARGEVIRYQFGSQTPHLLATKQGELKGLCAGENGSVFVVNSKRGAIITIGQNGELKTLIEGLSAPKDVYVHQGTCYVTEAGKGRVIAFAVDSGSAGKTSTFLEGLDDPNGMTVIDNELFILDRGSRSLWRVKINQADSAEKVATHLPVGALGPLDFSGGICRNNKSELLIAADGEGSILRLSQH